MDGVVVVNNEGIPIKSTLDSTSTVQVQNFKKELLEIFYLNSTLNFGMPTVLVFQLEVYYKVDRLLIGLPAQQKGTTARWYSNKTSLVQDDRGIEIWKNCFDP